MTSFFKIGSNQRERSSKARVHLSADSAGTELHRIDALYSYDTLVAFWDINEQLLNITSQHHSATTTRHLNHWTQSTRFYGVERRVVPQATCEFIHHAMNKWEADQFEAIQ